MKYPCLGDSSVDILYLAMQAIVRQKGTEEQFGEPISSTQQILPPRGVSETKMKVYQVRGRLFHGVLLGTTQHQVFLPFLRSEVQRGPVEAVTGELGQIWMICEVLQWYLCCVEPGVGPGRAQSNRGTCLYPQYLWHRTRHTATPK